ncbi:hypothetical protein ACPXCG_15760 [Gordonia sp. DT218]|uniref:hypothetical protein n=1 Tax=unclassified Gordonia (in: high G+C Gram-positive bacteria) TaxID=2657482 RepID=UPI003CE78CF2
MPGNRVEFEVKLPGRLPVRYGMDVRTASVAEFEKDVGEYISNAEKMQRNGKAATGYRSPSDSHPLRNIRPYTRHGADQTELDAGDSCRCDDSGFRRLWQRWR